MDKATETKAHRGDVAKKAEEKDLEMHRQQERGEQSNESLRGHDKTDADSFPASDPPPHSTDAE